jgi:hypothetical protein
MYDSEFSSSFPPQKSNADFIVFNQRALKNAGRLPSPSWLSITNTKPDPPHPSLRHWGSNCFSAAPQIFSTNVKRQRLSNLLSLHHKLEPNHFHLTMDFIIDFIHPHHHLPFRQINRRCVANFVHTPYTNLRL